MDGESRNFAIMPGESQNLHPISRLCSSFSLSWTEKLDGAKSSLRTLINRLAVLGLMWSGSLLAQAPAPLADAYQPEVLTAETLRYRMVSGQTEVGEMSVDIARDQAAGVIQFVESVSGLFERSTVFTL